MNLTDAGTRGRGGECGCNPEATYSCWLQTDEMWFCSNFRILERGGRLSAYAFAREERARLADKIHNMKRDGIERIAEGYCCSGNRVTTEKQRDQAMLLIIQDKRK